MKLVSKYFLLKRNFILHIFPIKGLEEETIEQKETSALIACSSRLSRLKRAENADRFCIVSFADVAEPDKYGAMQEGHAILIRDFILGLSEGITDLYICCDSGESRSPAIAAALLSAGRLSDECIWRNPFYRPNTIVYQRMCEAFGMQVPEYVVKEKRFLNEEAYRKAKMDRSAAAYSRWQTIDMGKMQIAFF